MSEEEIRKILLCENIGELAYCGLLDKLDESNNNDLNELKKQAIQGLLGLYNKEKEKNKELEIRNEALGEITTYNQKNSIAKSKIKEKIEELEQNVKDFEEYWSEDPRKFKREKCIDYYKLESLQELLEEK